MNTKTRYIPLLFCIGILIILLLFTGCAGVSDFRVKLAGNYELWRSSAYSRTIHYVANPDDPNNGYIMVSSYVDRIAFDQEYIYVQKLQPDDTQYPPVNEDSPRVFLAIAVESGNLTSYMSESEFSEWYAALGREEPPEWISTKDQPALIDRWEELNPMGR